MALALTIDIELKNSLGQRQFVQCRIMVDRSRPYCSAKAVAFACYFIDQSATVLLKRQ